MAKRTSTLTGIRGGTGGGEGEAPKYDKSEFLIAASDANGHNSPVNFRCVSGYLRTIDEVIASRKFPYKTTSDVMRHALHRHVHWLDTLEPGTVELDLLDALIDMSRAKQELLRFHASLVTTEETINQLIRSGFRGEAKKLVLAMTKTIAQAKKNSFTAIIEEEIKRRFGYLIEKGVSLKEFDEED